MTEEELKAKIFSLVKEANLEKGFEDISGEPVYVTNEIMKLITIYRAQALEAVEDIIRGLYPRN